jgi:hypothetical protein
VLKNSIGKNKINKDIKKRINAQKIPCPDQVDKFLSTKPEDSISRYTAKPRSREPNVNKYRLREDLIL